MSNEVTGVVVLPGFRMVASEVSMASGTCSGDAAGADWLPDLRCRRPGEGPAGGDRAGPSHWRHAGRSSWVQKVFQCQ